MRYFCSTKLPVDGAAENEPINAANQPTDRPMMLSIVTEMRLAKKAVHVRRA